MNEKKEITIDYGSYIREQEEKFNEGRAVGFQRCLRQIRAYIYGEKSLHSFLQALPKNIEGESSWEWKEIATLIERIILSEEDRRKGITFLEKAKALQAVYPGK